MALESSDALHVQLVRPQAGLQGNPFVTEVLQHAHHLFATHAPQAEERLGFFAIHFPQRFVALINGGEVK